VRVGWLVAGAGPGFAARPFDSSLALQQPIDCPLSLVTASSRVARDASCSRGRALPHTKVSDGRRCAT
jgi:hypothetical protein